MYVCMYVCMYACVYVCVYVLCVREPVEFLEFLLLIFLLVFFVCLLLELYYDLSVILISAEDHAFSFL
jgi:hypothetical protein